MAWYFFTEDLASFCRSCNTLRRGSWAVFNSSFTCFFPRESDFRPRASSHLSIWRTELGFSRPVFSFRAAIMLSRLLASMATACRASSRSMAIPRSLISWSWWYSSHTVSGTGYFCSLSWMAISTSTSRLL